MVMHPARRVKIRVLSGGRFRVRAYLGLGLDLGLRSDSVVALLSC